MTGFPIKENAGCWWLTTWESWNRLHAVPGDTMTADEMHDAIDDGQPIERRTACGPVLGLTYAGLVSRFSMPRCAHCCKALGIPTGDGTPCNEKAEQRARAEATA